MVKFKLKIFRSCRSKDPSTLPEPLLNRHQQPQRPSFKSHVSNAFGCASKSAHSSDDDYFHWQQDDNHWHVVTKIYDAVSPRRKIYNSSVSGDVSDEDPFPLASPLQLQLPLLTVTEKKKRRRSRKVKVNKPRKSVTSSESLVFSSENENENVYNIKCNNNVVLEDETETLISSSRSFSTDTSTEYNPQLETIRESACTSLAERYRKKRGAWSTRAGTISLSEYGTPARLSVFKRVIGCDVEGKMKESYAMVKRTHDPYEDFKRSMMEMIVEKRMYEGRDLEQLLECYLSLNSRVHHGVIVEVFEEIWDTMFGGV